MTKEEDFKQRFAAVLSDLQQSGSKNGAAMGLLAALASDLADKANARSWTEFKSRLNGEAYRALLETFRQKGNALHQAGKDKNAYAVQILTVSLIARTQTADPQMAEGERLMDALIDHVVELFRQQRQSAN